MDRAQQRDGAERLLTTLRARGVAIEAKDGDLVLDAPPGALDTTVLEDLRSHKIDLLALLAPEPADDLEATALLGEVFWARQDAARSALAGAPDGGTRIATYRAAIARWGGYLDGLADQGPGRDALESAAIGQLRRLQRGEVVPREQEAIA